jgi:hypothetical protein
MPRDSAFSRVRTRAQSALFDAGEESLLYDVFIEAATTDTGNINKRGSLDAIERPFYLLKGPRLEVPYMLPQRSDEAGDVLFFRGRVTSSDGTPLAGVELDMWQAGARMLSSAVDTRSRTTWRGRALRLNYNPPHNLSATGIYQLPFGHGKRFGGGMNRWLDQTIALQCDQLRLLADSIPVHAY